LLANFNLHAGNSGVYFWQFHCQSPAPVSKRRGSICPQRAESKITSRAGKLTGRAVYQTSGCMQVPAARSQSILALPPERYMCGLHCADALTRTGDHDPR
jgi:hypothetical protein